MKSLSLIIVFFLFSGCASTQLGKVASSPKDNLQVISSGTLDNGAAKFLSYYVIDKTLKECYTMLTMYSAIKIDCEKLKNIPEAKTVLKEIGI